VQRLEAIPERGWYRVAGPAIAGSNSSTSIKVEGYTAPEAARGRTITTSRRIFPNAGHPLIAGANSGRRFCDIAESGVVNEAFVEVLFPEPESDGPSYGLGQRHAQLDMEIVGVVKDAKYSNMKEPVPPVFYTPLSQSRGGQCISIKTGDRAREDDDADPARNRGDRSGICRFAI
jgi:hypothetical protein